MNESISTIYVLTWENDNNRLLSKENRLSEEQ